MAWLPMVLPGFMILGAFNLFSLAVGLEVAQEFMATMTSMGLPQVLQSLTQNSTPTPDLEHCWSTDKYFGFRGLGSFSLVRVRPLQFSYTPSTQGVWTYEIGLPQAMSDPVGS